MKITLKNGTSDICGWDLYRVWSFWVNDSGSIVPSYIITKIIYFLKRFLNTKSSWIQDRTIGNFSGACFSANRSKVVRNVRHFDTKSLIWDSVYCVVVVCCDVTVWRTTGCVITFVGITDDWYCMPLGVLGSK